MSDNTSLETAPSYDALVENYRKVLEGIAHSWLMRGASAFVLTEGKRILFSAPEGVRTEAFTLEAALPEVRDGHLWIAISDTTSMEQSRLDADALMIRHLMSLERELNSMTDEMITLQDQQLALYDLNRALDQCVELHASLAVIARISQRLFDASNTVTALEINGKFVVEQTGDELPPYLIKTAFATNHQETRSAEPLRLDGGYMLCLPMNVRAETSGVLVILRRQGFKSPEIKLARTVAEQGRTHLHNVLLHEEQVAQARLQTEMELARRVQTQLLPRRLIPQAGIDVHGASIAALDVGGDFFDFIVKPGVSPIIVIGDVAGKGLPAALVMTMTRTAMRSAMSAAHHSPAELLCRVNDDLYDDFTELGLFTTAFALHYQPEDGQFIYANAGHSPVVYYVPGEGARMLEAEDTALGVLPFCSCQDRSLSLPPGALLVAATDGLVEAEDATGQRFGYDPFMREIEQNAHLTAEELTRHLFAVVSQFRGDRPQSDDQTLVVLKRTDS